MGRPKSFLRLANYLPIWLKFGVSCKHSVAKDPGVNVASPAAVPAAIAIVQWSPAVQSFSFALLLAVNPVAPVARDKVSFVKPVASL